MQATPAANGNELINLDIEALRAFAIIVTLVAHIVMLNPRWVPELTYFWLGIGVDLFFAISGFVITLSFTRRRREVGADVSYIMIAKAFWLRRIFRLWPAAVVWSALTVIVAFLLNDATTFGHPNEIARTWLSSVLQLTNAHLMSCNWFKTYSCSPDPLWHFWSLALEEQFYFLFPFLVFIFRGRLFALAGVLALLQAVTIRPWASPLWFFRTDALLFGVMIGCLRSRDRLGLKVAALEHPVIGRAAAVGILLLLVLVSRPSWSAYYMGLVAIVSAIAVWIASYNRCYFVRSERSKLWAGYLGSRSYSIYVIHLPVFAIARYAWQKHYGELPWTTALDLLLMSTAFALTFLLAEFSYKVIEAPTRAYGRRLTSMLDHPDMSCQRPAPQLTSDCAKR